MCVTLHWATKRFQYVKTDTGTAVVVAADVEVAVADVVPDADAVVINVQQSCKILLKYSVARGIARNLIWEIYVLTSHSNFKTC